MIGAAEYDRLVTKIYDAGLENRGWDEVVVDMSRLLGCIQGTIELHDHQAGLSEYAAPLCDQSFHAPFRQYYRHLFSLAGRSHRFAVGALYTSADLGVDEAFRRGEYWNEWWLPQGTGGATLMTNVAKEGKAIASVTVYKPKGVDMFSAQEQAAFVGLAGHLRRGVAVQRQLRLADRATRSMGGMRSSAGFVMAAADGRVLRADAASLAALQKAGLLHHDPLGERIVSPNGGLERLIARACCPRAGVGERAGEVTVRTGADSALAISVIPCARVTGSDGSAAETPAAMLCLADPDAMRQAIVQTLVEDYGLTRAEALVAIEIGRGAGRAAAAAHLGIRETTVRTHLSTIFDKLNLRRQAELCHFLARL